MTMSKDFDFLAFLMQHRDKLGMLAYFLPVAAKFIGKRAFGALGLLVLEIARQIIAEQLNDDEKREAFKQQILGVMPWWVKSFVKPDMMSEILDNLYLVLVITPIDVPKA